MRVPSALYQIERTLRQPLPSLRPAQHRGLALWVYGTILAQSACQSAVIATLLILGSYTALRQSLREWLYAGADKAAPCQTEVEVHRWFAPLLRWARHGARAALDCADRSRPAPGWCAVVRPAHVDRIGVPGAEEYGLAVARHPLLAGAGVAPPKRGGGRLWQRLWLTPDPWPIPPPTFPICVHPPPEPARAYPPL